MIRIMLLGTKEDRRYMRRQESAGEAFSLLVAGTAEQAIAMLADNSCDLILLSQSMLQATPDLPADLDAASGGAPVLLLCSRHCDYSADELRKLGCAEFVVRRSFGKDDDLRRIVRHVLERSVLEQQIRQRLAMEHLAADIAADFINPPGEQLDQVINRALQRIGSFAEADRSYVFTLSDDGLRASNTHEWCAEGIAPQIEVLQNLSTESTDWSISRLRRNEVVLISRLEDLPPEAAYERHILEQQQIRSVVLLPMHCNSLLIGFLGFDAVQCERIWSEADVDLLKIIGGIFAVAISHRKDEENRHLLEAQLRQSQKMEAIGNLAGGVAHDFRNQLTVIKGFGEMLQRRSLVGSGGEDKLDQILKAAERSAQLAGQLLAFGRKGAAISRRVDVSELLTEMAKLLPRIIGEDIKLCIIPASRPLHVLVDPNQFQQALINLAINARQAMPEGGELTIESRLGAPAVGGQLDDGAAGSGGLAIVIISDTGCGMDEQTQAQLFEPFFTTKPAGEGTGLGLPMVYAFVKESGGRIEVRSAPNCGTTFLICLPLSDECEAAAPDDATAGHAATGGRETLLLVEDDSAVRQMFAESLREAGYQVLEAGRADEALAIFGQHTPDVDAVITDVVMPGGSGFELVAAIRSQRPCLPVMFVSGYAGKELANRGMTVETTGAIMSKPCSHERLLSAVRRLLDEVRQS